MQGAVGREMGQDGGSGEELVALASKTHLNGAGVCDIQLCDMSNPKLLQLSSFRWVSATPYHLVAFGNQLPSPLQHRPKLVGVVPLQSPS